MKHVANIMMLCKEVGRKDNNTMVQNTIRISRGGTNQAGHATRQMGATF
jgi:murein endopeptidase